MSLSHRLGAACALVLSCVCLSAQAVGVSSQGTWESTLQGRDLDGNLATRNGIWLYLLAVALALGLFGAIPNTANASTVYTGDLFQAGTARTIRTRRATEDPDPMTSSIAMAYDVFADGNLDYSIYMGIRLATDPVSNLSFYTSSAMETTPGYFGSYSAQVTGLKANTDYVLAAYAIVSGVGTFYVGNYRALGIATEPISSIPISTFVSEPNLSDPIRVGAVPIPAGMWLLVSGLLGLIGLAKRKKAT